MTADTLLHTSARAPASVADPGAGNNHKREMPADNLAAAWENTRKKGARKLSSWRLLGLSGLLTGLLLTLVYTTNTEFTRLTEQNLITPEQSDGQKASSIADGEFSHSISKANEDMSMGTVVRKPSSVSNSSGNEASENDTMIHEPDPDPEQEHGLGGMQSKALGLEEELQQSGLLTERLPNHHLKVKLSSEGLFDFDSARIKQDALPALEKLADVLRKHDDLSIHIVGHTDNSGVAAYDLHLSQLSAKAIADYLVSQGLADSSIQSEGRGYQDTRLEQSTSDSPNLKRRIEIYIRRTHKY
jgi:outer membrane protein OmpA-like peptidoglycan-associated protein